MNYQARWKTIDGLGEGGQGKVFSVLDLKKVEKEARTLNQVLGRSWGTQNEQEYRSLTFQQAVLELTKSRDTEYLGALKVLHAPDNAREPRQAEERIKREIEVMSEYNHPGLLKILDHDPDYRWYVSQYYPRGTLAKSSTQFTADLPGALLALRPVIEAVAHLHESGHVHRDIKPDNIFVTNSGDLVLGDFGIVYFKDASHTRLSVTYENVGSRDWMPGWAMGMRIEDLEPNFDVFCLGKTLWSMLSTKPILRLWYFRDVEFDLTRQFPRARYMELAHQVFSRCIVEKPDECLPNATTLLEYVDEILEVMDAGAEYIDKENFDAPHRRCNACGIGRYRLMPGDLDKKVHISTMSDIDVRTLLCDRCGNVQFFLGAPSVKPEVWP